MPYIFRNVFTYAVVAQPAMLIFDALRHIVETRISLRPYLYYPNRVQNAMRFVRSHSRPDTLAGCLGKQLPSPSHFGLDEA